MPYKDRADMLANKSEWSHAHPNHKRNKVLKAETDRKYRLAHKEAIAANKRRYYEDHKEESRIYQQLYQRQYRQTHNRYHTPEGKRKITFCNQTYRTRKRGLPATLTLEEWEQIQKQFKHKCAYCGKIGKLTQDHVIPVSLGGGLTKDNIVPACLPCNGAKRDRLMPIGCWHKGHTALLTLSPIP